MNLFTSHIYAATSEKGTKARVLAGRIDPECNPNLRGYVPCEAASGSSGHHFDCQDQLFSRIVVQATGRILSFKVIDSPMPAIDDSVPRKQLEAYMKQKDEWINQISQKVTHITLFSWPGVLKLVGENVFPVSSLNSETFIAGSTLGKGRLVAINLRDIYVHSMENNQFLDNLSRWASRGLASSIKSVKKVGETSLSSVGSEDLLLWKAHAGIGEIEMSDLTKKIKAGTGIIIVFNSYYYNRDVRPIEGSEIARFLLQFGIVPTEDYINQAAKENKLIDWNSMRAFKSPALYLRLMAHSLSELRTGMKTWLDITPHIPGLYDRDLRTMLDNYLPLLEDAVACRYKSVSDGLKMDLLRIFGRLFTSPLLKNLAVKAPGAFAYQGDLVEATPLSTVRLNFYCHSGYEIIQTGYYLPPGRTLRASLLSSNMKSAKFWVNYQLFDVTDKTYYLKYPYGYSSSVSWSQKKVEMFSGLGGLVWFQCGHEGQNAKVELDGVIEAPMLNIRDPESIAAWPVRQFAPAPMATVAGDSVIFAVPSSSVRSQSELVASLGLYDKCIKNQVHLAGEDFAVKRREVIASDAQILAGWMHAGYPIGIFVEVTDPSYENFIFNASLQSAEGMWGLYHELGHNRQSSRWTSKTTTEITNNLFAALCDQEVAGRGVWAPKKSWLDYRNWQYTMMKPYLEQTGAEAESKWGDGSWTTLAVYMQVQGAFGWELYRQVFRNYRKLDKADANELFTDDDIIHSFFFSELSRVSGYNLIPLFRFWRAPVSQEAIDSVSHLPAFLPDDFMTQTVPEITERVLAEFGPPGSVVRAVNTPLVEKVGPLVENTSQIQGVRQIFVDSIVINEDRVAEPQPHCWSRVI